MLDNWFKWLAYLCVVGAILGLGWKQPLSYRFMSKAEIIQLETPATPVPTPTPPKATPIPATPIPATPAPATPVPATPVPWMWDPNRKATLDREPTSEPKRLRSTGVPRQY